MSLQRLFEEAGAAVDLVTDFDLGRDIVEVVRTQDIEHFLCRMGFHVYGPLIEGAAAEPTGWEGNFYRVNLSVIKKGQIPYAVFFDAFVRSVNGIRPITVAAWKVVVIIMRTLIKCVWMKKVYTFVLQKYILSASKVYTFRISKYILSK